MKRAFGWLGWALLFWLAGCATIGTPLPSGPRDGEAKAVAIVWRVYDRADLPPMIRWRQGADLTCIDPSSGKAGFPIPHIPTAGEPEPAVCREGLTMSFLECYVAWHEGDTFSTSAMPHELLHVAQARRGIFDPKHDNPEWNTLLPRAREALGDAGL